MKLSLRIYPRTLPILTQVARRSRQVRDSVLQLFFSLLTVLLGAIMGALNLSEWRKLPMSLSELCINTTLRCGQSFRYRLSLSNR